MAQPDFLSLKTGKKGDIHAWLVAGPYPNEGALQLRGTGFKTDYLGGEDKSNPSEGLVSGAHKWKFVVGDSKSGLNLKRVLPTDQPAIGYCFTMIDSPREMTATLLFGSDDGARVYLNGETIYSKQVARGVKRDEESLPIRLRRGRNRLMFKVEQGDGGWGLMARIVHSNGQAIEGLHQEVVIEKTAQENSFLRQFVGLKGAFDIETWLDCRAIRTTATRWLVHMSSKAKSPEKLRAALDASSERIGAAGLDCDKVNKACTESDLSVRSAYKDCRSDLLKWAQHPGSLESTDVIKEDFIRVMKGGRYFVNSSGKPFIPIGYNHNPDWPELEQSDPLRDDFDPGRTEKWFSNLERHGVNVIRLMVETPPSGNLEERPGLFRPEHLLWLDQIVICARRHNVKLWITPYDTFWMSLKKETSTYWAENGGPIRKPIDFLTSSKIMELQKKRMKLLIDRYGNLGTVFAWEIMNEIDLWWNATPEQIKTWSDEMATFVRSYQLKKWGRAHLITLSFAAPEPKGLNATTAFQRKDLDFATMHLYLGVTRAPKPGDASQAGKDFASGVHYARNKAEGNRPVLDGESGPIDKWVTDVRLDNQVFHEMSWAHLLAGGAGPGTRWPYRQPHHITQGMLETLKAIRTFSDEVPWEKMTGPEEAAKVTSGTSFATHWAGIARFTGKTATLELEGLYRYRLFDSVKGVWLTPVKEHSGKLEFEMPTHECALWFERL